MKMCQNLGVVPQGGTRIPNSGQIGLISGALERLPVALADLQVLATGLIALRESETGAAERESANKVPKGPTNQPVLL